MVTKLAIVLRLVAAAGIAWTVGIGGPAAATGNATLDALTRDVDGTSQSQANLLHSEYLRHLGAFEASIKRCTAFLRTYGDRDRIRALVLRQREQPGDIFLVNPEDIEALEDAVGKPIDLSQLDLEICSRARDQGLANGGYLRGLTRLGDTVGACLASLKRVGPNAAGVAVLQNVSRGISDPSFTSGTTLDRLERAVGHLPITEEQLETCADAYHIAVNVEHVLIAPDPTSCTSCGGQGLCCPAGQNCVLPSCRNCQPYCVTPACFPATATVQLEDGSTKAMPDVRLGDRVLVARADGSLGFEDVYLNTHKDRVSAAPYVELALASGRSLSLSPRHFIPVATGPDGAWDDHVAKGADEIAAGDHVWSRSAAGTMQRDQVVAAETKIAVGAFNPLTMNGTIVVDGVVASAHSDWFLDGIVSADTQTKVYQAILAPVRLAYAVLGPERMEAVTERWGVVDAVRNATTPGSRDAGWVWVAIGILAAVLGALAWRRRAGAH
jgi:hypothetical protein